MALADNLFAFGNRGGLFTRIERDREVRLNNQKKEHELATSQRNEQKASRLSELYAQSMFGNEGGGIAPILANGPGNGGGVGAMFANAGNRRAEQEIARLDPNFHMALQKNRMDMQKSQWEHQTNLQEQLGRQAIWANDEQKWSSTPFAKEGITFDQREAVIGEYIGAGDTFRTVQDNERAQTGFELQRRGQDITRRGQDITLRGQDMDSQRGTGDMRKYNELAALGVPDEVARGVAYGTYRNVTDPASGATLIIDLTSNQPIGRMVPSDPSKPYTSGYRWEPDMKTGMIQRPAGGSAPNMNAGTIERGMVPPGNPYADPNDPLGLFK